MLLQTGIFLGNLLEKPNAKQTSILFVVYIKSTYQKMDMYLTGRTFFLKLLKYKIFYILF